MDVTNLVTVYPEEGNFPAIARGLLEAADHPYQVRSVTHPRAGFEVPEEVLARFEATLPASDESSAQQEDSPGEAEAPKRRPGRPRKNAEPEPQAPSEEQQ